MPLPLLLLQDISLTLGVTPLLSGAALAVASGDRICLVGRNGSGKVSIRRGPQCCHFGSVERLRRSGLAL
jgi:ATPase subunit of ABC transporter with duplicated ATPase domains